MWLKVFVVSTWRILIGKTSHNVNYFTPDFFAIKEKKKDEKEIDKALNQKGLLYVS